MPRSGRAKVRGGGLPALCLDVAEIGQTNHYEGERWIEAKLVEFIMCDEVLRKRAIDWNRRCFVRGGGSVPSPKRDEHFARVRAYLRALF